MNEPTPIISEAPTALPGGGTDLLGLPWCIDDPNGEMIARLINGTYHYVGEMGTRFTPTTCEEDCARAAYAVLAANHHAELVAALEAMIQADRDRPGMRAAALNARALLERIREGLP